MLSCCLHCPRTPIAPEDPGPFRRVFTVNIVRPSLKVAPVSSGMAYCETRRKNVPAEEWQSSSVKDRKLSWYLTFACTRDSDGSGRATSHEVPDPMVTALPADVAKEMMYSRSPAKER